MFHVRVPYVRMAVSRGLRPSGHLQVKGRRGARRYYALWRDDDGRHQRLLGPAHVKDSGRKTARGATIWRTADGPKPGPEWLTPEQAAVALRALLAAAPVTLPETSRLGTRAGILQAVCSINDNTGNLTLLYDLERVAALASRRRRAVSPRARPSRVARFLIDAGCQPGSDRPRTDAADQR